MKQEISGFNYYADLYYASAHLRQLIDIETSQEEMKEKCFTGVLTEKDFYAVIRSAYNGFGDHAKDYSDSAKLRINNAIEGKEHLYFYEK